MSLVDWLLALSVLAVVLTGGAAWLILRLIRLRRQLGADAVRRVRQSRSVLMGQVAEHFAPLLPGFGYHPKDARFMGQPVDYLVFNGLTAGAADLELVFCEIKTGQSILSPTEQAIRQAIIHRRIRFETLRILADGSIRRE